jgi:nucleotide-binding universal stress UspA family protein
MATVVVGVDGSPGGQEALRFAIEEARLRMATLKVVLAWGIPFSGGVPFGMIPSMLAEFQAEAESVLDEEIAKAGAIPVPVERVLVEGAAARALIEAAQGADLLVVGSRGRGGFKGLLLGSVSQQCAHHTPCPIMIVPQHEG